MYFFDYVYQNISIFGLRISVLEGADFVEQSDNKKQFLEGNFLIHRPRFIHENPNIYPPLERREEVNGGKEKMLNYDRDIIEKWRPESDYKKKWIRLVCLIRMNNGVNLLISES